MPVLPTQPVPVPTPYQPPSMGGNSTLRPGTIGPYLPQTAVPTSGSNGMVTYSTGTSYPASSVNPVSYTPPPRVPQTTQTVSSPNYDSMIDLYRKSGWTDLAAIKADIAATGGMKAPGTGTSAPSFNYDQYPNSDFGSYNFSPDQFFSEIDNSYNTSMDYANRAEQSLGEQKQSAMDAAQAQLAAAQSGLNTNKASSTQKINESATQAQQRKEDALAAARRLYSELQTGFNQRFGRASSAGEAAFTLGAMEQQRQQGGTQREFGSAMRQIEAQKVDLENNYNTKLQELDANFATAKNDIVSQFSQQLNQINLSRAQSAQEKSNARLGVLQNLRNQMNTLAQQREAFSQQLYAAKYQADMNLQNYAKTASMAGTNASSAYNTFAGNTTTSPTSSLKVGGGTANVAYTPTGYYQPKSQEDLVGIFNSGGQSRNVSFDQLYDNRW